MDENPVNDIFFMRQALVEAHKALGRDEIPIGAVAVCGGRIVGRGHNMTEALLDVTAHAEMQAITAASNTLSGKYLGDCTLYVTLEPCPMCAGALCWSQVGRLVYGAADPKGGYMRFGSAMLHTKTEVTGGVLADECAALMKDFFRDKR